MDECILNNLLSVIIPSVIAVSGWVAVDGLNRRLRREEAMRTVYYKLFNMTSDLLDECTDYYLLISRKTSAIEDIIKESNKTTDSKSKSKMIAEWGERFAQSLMNHLEHRRK